MLRFDLDAMQEYIATVYIITKKGTLSSVWLKPRASRAQFGDGLTPLGGQSRRVEDSRPRRGLATFAPFGAIAGDRTHCAASPAQGPRRAAAMGPSGQG
jgi:hypothetical protein